MARHADWLAPPWGQAGVGGLMTTRHGGCSAGPFASMNLQFGGGDAASSVARNRALLAEASGASPVFLRQVHSCRVVRLRQVDTLLDAPTHEADASVVTEPGVACTVLVADCLPVLFAAPGGRAVAAAHAGWRGLAAGVLEATVGAVCEAARCEPDSLQVWLGAAIGPQRFQVGADVLEAFGVDATATASVASLDGAPHARFKPESGVGTAGPPGPQKWLADLPGLATDRLRATGVRAIAGGSWCTASEPSRFFSFRRERITGRMAAAVWIERRH